MKKQNRIQLLVAGTMILSSVVVPQAILAKPVAVKPVQTTTAFTQGTGYHAGSYDYQAAQPSTYKWPRQSRYNVAPNPVEKWSITSGKSIKSSPVVTANGTIYVTSNGGEFYAYQNGRINWKTLLKGDLTSSVIGKDGTIYTGSTEHHLFAVYPSGVKKWEKRTVGEVTTSPALGSDGTIYVGTGDGKLQAFNENGSEKWTFSSKAPVTTAPIISKDQVVYVGNSDGKLYAVHAASGKSKWTLALNAPMKQSPVIGNDGTLYLGT